MRIALYNVMTAASLRGIESCVWELARAYRALGHVPEVITGTGPINPYGETDVRAFPYLPRRSYSFLPVGPRKLLERLIFFLIASPYLVRTPYDVFVFFKPLDLPAALFLKCFHPKMKLVFFSGGTDFIYVDKWLGGTMNRVCAPSAHNALILEARYQRPVTVAYYGVATDRFAPSEEAGKEGRARLGVPARATLLLSVGQLIAWKGHDVVIRALPSLPGVRYAVIGVGEEEARLRALAEELGVADRLILAGKKDNADIPLYMNAADLYVHPSYEEPLGLVVLEALACGVPVVVGDSGGVVELVEDGTNGRIARTGDPEDFARKIGEALRERPALSAVARESVLASFTWERTARTLIEGLYSPGARRSGRARARTRG